MLYCPNTFVKGRHILLFIKLNITSSEDFFKKGPCQTNCVKVLTIFLLHMLNFKLTVFDYNHVEMLETFPPYLNV